MRSRLLLAVFVSAVMSAADGQKAASEKRDSQAPARSAQPQQEQAKTPARAAISAQKAAQQAVPAGAEKTDVNSWRYKDPQGKTWIYRQTPFGLVHFEGKPEEEIPLPPGMKAIDEGENVRFERPSPFGDLKWVKAKSELNDVERKVWERDSKKTGETGAAKPSEAGKPAGK